VALFAETTKLHDRLRKEAACLASATILAFTSFSNESPLMLRRLPPLNSLKAFEAAARSESFTRAAEELSVTQAAVSQQIKTLEVALGLKLFNRERQRLVITEAGRTYLAVVRDALDRIAVGTDRLVQDQSTGILTAPRHRTLPLNGLCIGSVGSQNPIRRSTCASPQQCITSTSRASKSTLQFDMVRAIGPALTPCVFARNGFFR
jgi:DNA-binding transcriptional LysR family regulator